MATIRIHEDQENRIGDSRRGKENSSLAGHQGNGLQQNKRPVLAVLHNNCHRNAKTEICGKDEKYMKPKVFASVQSENFKVFEEKKDEAIIRVYEDITPTNYENKLVKETSVVLRETRETTEVQIKENIEITQKSEHEKPTVEVNPSNVGVVPPFCTVSHEKRDDGLFSQVIPMSLEKSLAFIDSSKKQDQKAKREAFKSLKNSFFDVDEYRADIYNYLRVAETHHRPKPGYMKKQPDITSSMRSILVDWLVEVAEEYRLHSETLYLAVSYIDRFLSYMSVVRAKLQLVGTAAMFIAAKYEEIYPPDVGEFVYITDDTYTKKQVLRMEHLILRVLSFDLTVPTPLAFLRDYCISNNLSERILFLAMYLCELSMLEADPYLHYIPSHLAAAAVALARHTLQEEIWPHELELSTGYSLKDLRTCIGHLHKTFASAPNIQQQAIQEKYKSSKYGHVALLLPRSTDPLSSEDELGSP